MLGEGCLITMASWICLFQEILVEGGLYTFQIRARERVGTGFGDSVVTNVTVVITDQNDQVGVDCRRSKMCNRKICLHT